MNRLYVMALTLTGALLSGCSWLGELDQAFVQSSINNDHSLLQHDPKLLQADVYFIRPKTEHPQGLADQPLTVETDGEQLMSLAKAEYTLVHLKPRSVTITMRNKTQTRGRWEIEEMTTSRRFEFQAGETYFILAQPVDGEFRGARFVPTQLSEHEAKKASRYLSPAGEAANQPIHTL